MLRKLPDQPPVINAFPAGSSLRQFIPPRFLIIFGVSSGLSISKLRLRPDVTGHHDGRGVYAHWVVAGRAIKSLQLPKQHRVKSGKSLVSGICCFYR
ncbi:hypothetical protein KCP74_06580 [Salmonella enterica subsp. enterica]|nr:hypothetical protein KCP74_06580 [Salmonella enterica subsp. enterica]